MEKRYVQTDNEFNILNIIGAPNWYLENGHPITDGYLALEKIYPLDETKYKPKFDDKLQYIEALPYNEWEYKEINNTQKIFYMKYKVLDYDIEKLKNDQLNIIKGSYSYRLNNEFNSKVINKGINGRTSDLTKIQNIYNYMYNNNIDIIDFRLYDNTFISINKQTVRDLYNELLNYHMLLSNKKWEYEKQISDITIPKDVLKVVWVD